MTIAQLYKWACQEELQHFDLELSKVIALGADDPELKDYHVVLDIPLYKLWVNEETKEIRLATDLGPELGHYLGRPISPDDLMKNDDAVAE
jgi:hypothetical protein